MAATTSNPFARVLDANKLSGPENFSDWELDLKIVLRSEKLTYVLENPLPLDIAPELHLKRGRHFKNGQMMI